MVVTFVNFAKFDSSGYVMARTQHMLFIFHTNNATINFVYFSSNVSAVCSSTRHDTATIFLKTCFFFDTSRHLLCPTTEDTPKFSRPDWLIVTFPAGVEHRSNSNHQGHATEKSCIKQSSLTWHYCNLVPGNQIASLRFSHWNIRKGFHTEFHQISKLWDSRPLAVKVAA